MLDHTTLSAIDDSVGASTTCGCGRELLAAARGDTLWLECPVFAGPSRLPAALVRFARDAAHDRRVVGSLRSAASVDPVRRPDRVATALARSEG